MTNDGVRHIETIPEEVSRTIVLFMEIARKLLLRKVMKEITFQGFPNCHGVARAYASAFKHLEVVDGAVAYFTIAGPRVMNHSWVRFKNHPKFGVDVSPVGAVPFMSSPNLLYFDGDVLHQECTLPSDVLEGSQEGCDQLLAEILPIVLSFTSKEEKAA
jgi:hypothetical protein